MSLSLILIHIKKEWDEQQHVVATQNQHIEELGRQLESVNEELKMGKQKLLSVQEVCVAMWKVHCYTVSSSRLTCNNRKEKSNTEY